MRMDRMLMVSVVMMRYFYNFLSSYLLTIFFLITSGQNAYGQNVNGECLNNAIFL